MAISFKAITSDFPHFDRNGSKLPLYEVRQDGKVLGYVGQFPTPGHHKGIRPNSSTGTIRRWGYQLPGCKVPRISTIQWGCYTRAEALEGLLRELEA